ncbi:DUF4097 family beta strand repeat-containing protein [Croceivirga thetidis]|uniref:DUF4097 domain-containing protein n=1 Tax=Croceivirga thetidis TaxID=2721623 RepID=A0ABX1GPI1_9FLAO|nr:DUF4097 family beta strand repeat-containing protein [Croceivirga thetidis]NKI30672.1 hypothetical protein [Croceivirga thetidis]
MKTFKSVLLVLTISLGALLQGQEFKETIKKELQFSSNGENNILNVQNVNGGIEVEGYNGNTILVEVRKTIKAKRQEYVDEGRQEIGISVENQGDQIYVYLDSPWTYFDSEKGRFSHREQYNNNDRPKYRYHLDFTIRVPFNTGLSLGTMNDGDILVKDVQGSLMNVNNLNGGIDLENIAGTTDVNALNRDINITYQSNPTEDCYYNSLNGDITVVFKDNLNADVSFKSMNGDLYTNYDTVTLKPEVVQKEIKGKKGIKYKIDSKESFRIGNGGIKLDFNLLNGDALVKK